jgi:menaquinone-dependent protoporphyrinogen oxidase
MKTLIAFATRYGTSEACAHSLADIIGQDTSVMNLRRNRLEDGSRPDLLEYDAIIIGGPIYAGKVMREVPAFCEANRSILEAKAVGLYICCLYEGEQAEAELTESFPAWLNAHAAGRYALGGAVSISQLSIVDRFLMRKIAGTEKDLNTVKNERIEALAADLSRAVSG